MLAKLVRRGRVGCDPPPRDEPTGCCLSPNVPIDRPDPAIYSQKQVLASSGSPSWDSPDILTNSWAPFALLPETKVTVRNLSTSVSAANVQVGIAFSAFGIGMPQASLSSVAVSLPPLGSAQLNFPLSQALLNGDPLVCIFVKIVHAADVDPSNNEGGQSVTGGQTSVTGRNIEFDIPVRNDTGLARAMTFVTYANVVGFTVSPTSHSFAPFEQIVVKGKIKVAPGLHAAPDWIEQTATMAALSGGALVGGITYVVKIDD